jgi:hypothetical protein
MQSDRIELILIAKELRRCSQTGSSWTDWRRRSRQFFIEDLKTDIPEATFMFSPENVCARILATPEDALYIEMRYAKMIVVNIFDVEAIKKNGDWWTCTTDRYDDMFDVAYDQTII